MFGYYYYKKIYNKNNFLFMFFGFPKYTHKKTINIEMINSDYFNNIKY